MVHATVRMVIPANERGEVLEILRSIAERTRLEQGCIGCDVYQAAEEDLAILVEELWKSEEDLERHLRSEEYRKLLLVVEMALEREDAVQLEVELPFVDVQKAVRLAGRHVGALHAHGLLEQIVDAVLKLDPVLRPAHASAAA